LFKIVTYLFPLRHYAQTPKSGFNGLWIIAHKYNKIMNLESWSP